MFFVKKNYLSRDFSLVKKVLVLTLLCMYSVGVYSQLIPADLMDNCKQWKITYPTGTEDKTLCDEANNEFFYVNEDQDAIVFRAPVRSDNGTTPNSSNIRSELRERVEDGSVDIYWTTDGSHLIYVKQAITHLPINKPQLVATQIHGNKDDGIDDSMVMRLEENHLFLSFNGGKLRSNVTITENYTLGTIHETIFYVEDGKHYCYYAEDGNLLTAYNNNNAAKYLVKDGDNDYLMDLSYDQTYFKVGNYTQSNPEKEGEDTDDPDNYGEVLVYDFLVEHGEVSVDGVTLSPSNLEFSVGSIEQLSATVSPAGATNTTVSYTSSNTAVATVDSDGKVTAVSKGDAIITVTTEEGAFTSTCMISVIDAAEGDDLASKKLITGTGTHDGDNEVANLVDGNTETRWSVSGYPQTATIDLGTVYAINRTELVAFKDRDYQFTISGSTTLDGDYVEIVDRSNNTTPGGENSPITDIFEEKEVRYLKMEVSGAATYTGTWISLLEFSVFGKVGGLSTDDVFNPQNQILLFPNPVQDVIHINQNRNDNYKSIIIYDPTGKMVYQKDIVEDTVNIQDLDAGLYVVSLISSNSIVKRTIVKM